MTKKHKEQEDKATVEQEGKLDPKESKIAELTDSLQRLQAEFENYKKREEKDRQIVCRYASADVIKKILPIVDSFELALMSNKKNDDFARGIEMIYSSLVNTLAEIGLRKIECKGKKFDPSYHDVLLSEESEIEEDTIIEEIQKGYMLNDMILRHSKVKISKKKETKDESQG